MLGPELQIIIVTLIFLGLLTAGMAVPFAIAVPAVIYLLMQGGFPALNGLGLMSWGSMNTFALTAVPLFMFMADILSVSGLSNRIYNGLAKLVAPLPGGLLQTNIAGCAIFASVSGSSIATAASIGGVALPQLTSRNYHRALAAGSLAAGGTLGILIPPSFPMIIYGTFTETSVPKLFIAGVIPGLIMTALFMLYIGVHAQARAERRAEGAGRAQRARGDPRARRHRAVRGADRRHARRALFRRGDHDRGGGDRLLPVDPARLPVRRPHLEQAGRGDAFDRQFLRQHPVPDLRRLCVLLRDQLRRHRREADRVHRRHEADARSSSTRCCSCCSPCSAA